MPHEVDLIGTRGDHFLRAITILHPGPPPTPLTLAEGRALAEAYPVIQMQVRAKATDPAVLIELSAADGHLQIDPAYPQPDGTLGCALVITAPAELCGAVIDGVYDVQFDHSGSAGPLTWVTGGFVLEQDVTRAAP
jgi:hypothetical protein